jgi:hypothetical protein
LEDALRATYVSCVGIDDELADLKKMAGINTAITAVGTAAGAGAVVTGLVKMKTDRKAEELEKMLQEIDEMHKSSGSNLTAEEYEVFLSQFNAAYNTDMEDKETLQEELDKTVKKSKNLGNWRTGLLAGSTVTNIAGAIIAGGNKVDGDLNAQIENCKASVKNLRNAMMQARINGIDITEAQAIADACGEFEYADISKINTKAKGAMISSTVGAVTGVGGTVTSAIANTDKTRNDNSDAGKKKEKNLNTAANVLAGATTLASATATVFNATQISAIKKVASVAEKCTGVLK